MKTLMLSAGALLVATTVSATPTTCTGSWDGVGMTACELLGRQGETGVDVDFTKYIATDVLFEITAWDEGNTLVWNDDGTLTYTTGFKGGSQVYNTKTHPHQFAYWFNADGTMDVGIEDIPLWWESNDKDYNDFAVKFKFDDEVYIDPRTNNVPEPGLVGLMLIGMGALLRRMKR